MNESLSPEMQLTVTIYRLEAEIAALKVKVQVQAELRREAERALADLRAGRDLGPS